MDTTAIYFTLATVGLIVILSVLVIVPRRIYLRLRNRPADAVVTAKTAGPILAVAIGFLLCMAFYPWLGLILFAILLASCAIQLSLAGEKTS